MKGGAKKRWAGIPKAERSRIMSEKKKAYWATVDRVKRRKIALAMVEARRVKANQ